MSKTAGLDLFSVSAGVGNHEVVATDRGTNLVKGIEIFKAGTFKDSMGDLKTWTIEQLNDMASNFKILKDLDIFPNVPVRKDHSWSIDDVVGYIENLYVTGIKLVADIEFTEVDSFNKFQSGTFRSRSLEVGPYEDNSQITHWPVVMGLAFVDIPAVEGLHALGRGVNSYRFSTEEIVVPELFKFRIGQDETTDYAKVQAYVAQLETANGTLVAENASLTTTVEALNTAAKEQGDIARKAFVAKLATDKKIVQPQVESLEALVVTMSDDQYAAFCAAYDKAPASSLLSNHGNTVTNPDGNGTQPDARQDRIDILTETVKQHRRAGLSEEAIAKTKSAIELSQLISTGA